MEEKAPLEFKDQVVHINRVTKVVKGGKNLNFSALVVIGDGKGRVGFGKGKAKEVPLAIEKATKDARKREHMINVPLQGTTIPHKVEGKYCGGKVILIPARPGTGVIAGGPVRAVIELVGIQDILTKSLRSSNPYNVVQATFEALRQLKTKEQVSRLREKEITS